MYSDENTFPRDNKAVSKVELASNVDEITKKICDLKVAVNLLKTYPFFQFIPNMFENIDPSILGRRDELQLQLIEREKSLVTDFKKIESFSRLKFLSIDYACLGDIDTAILLLVKANLNSLKAIFCIEGGLLERAECLLDVVIEMSQVAEFVNSYESFGFLRFETLQMISTCISLALETIKPYETQSSRKYRGGFLEMLKKKKCEDKYECLKKYAKKTIVPRSIESVSIAGVDLPPELIQHVFGFTTLETLKRSASVCRFFKDNVDEIKRKISALKTAVDLLKTIPFFEFISNMFESFDPSVLRRRDELRQQLFIEEKLLAANGFETTQSRSALRALSIRYAELGDINKAISLLVTIDLSSLKSLANCNDVFEKADRLLRIVDVMGQVAEFVNRRESSDLVKPETMQMISTCISKLLDIAKSLEKFDIRGNKGFLDMLKKYKCEDRYECLKKYAQRSIKFHSTDGQLPAIAAAPLQGAITGMR